MKKFLLKAKNNLITFIPGYSSALFSGYIVMGLLMISQLLLTPFYLHYLTAKQFGLLMILFSFVNFAAIGISWASTGFVRVIGEFAANQHNQAIIDTMITAKYIFTIYGLVFASVSLSAWYIAHHLHLINTPLSTPIYLTTLYLCLSFENEPETITFVGMNKQHIGNRIETLRIIFFMLFTLVLLPILKNSNAIWIAMINSMLFRRVISAHYWKRHIGTTYLNWSTFKPRMKPILKRLTGRQGVAYALYGILNVILNTDTLLIAYLGGTIAAGQFVLLWKIPQTFFLLLQRIPSTLTPTIIQLDEKNEEKKLKTLFIQGRYWFFTLIFCVVVYYAILGHWMTTLWVGKHAPTHIWMYWICALSLLFSTIARWPTVFSCALIQLAPLVRTMFIEFIGKVTLTVLLYQYVGIAASVAATVIIHLVYLAWRYQKLVQFNT